MGRTKHGSLFSGIGGFDLAASWMGWDNVFQVELSAFCNTVLAHHFPATKRYRDIKHFKAEVYHGTIDVISGGFPCQPFSTAGKRMGSKDDRFLWPEALRVIGTIRPLWIVLENVAGLFSILEPASLSRMEIQEIELFCKDKNRQANKTIISVQRRVIGTIIDQIRGIGYILPTLSDGTSVIVCIPACAVGAPHRRDRIWIVAYAGGLPAQRIVGPLGDQVPGRQQEAQEPDAHRSPRPADPGVAQQPDLGFPGGQQLPPANRPPFQPPPGDSKDEDGLFPNADSDGRQRFDHSRRPDKEGRQDESGQPAQHTGDHWSCWPTQSPVCSGNDGLPRRLDTISFSKWRNESLHAFGNAIVPEVAYEIFQAIESACNQAC